MNNFVEVIGEYDKARERRWRFLIVTLVGFSIAGIYLLTVIVERYSSPQFLTIEQEIDSTIERTETQVQGLINPSEVSPVASPISETIEAAPTLNPIFAQATEHALSIRAATNGR